MSQYRITIEARQGEVHLRAGGVRYQLTPQEARAIARDLTALADCADTDAFDARMETLARKKTEAEKLAKEIAEMERA